MVFLSPIVFASAVHGNRAVRTVDALVTSLLVTQAVKSVVREERPDHSDSRSFPSEHTAGAFAIATVQAQFDPRSAPYWYAGAAAVGVWRVADDRHFVQDVVAGALIGHLIGRAAVDGRRGLLVTPIFENGSKGLAVVCRF